MLLKSSKNNKLGFFFYKRFKLEFLFLYNICSMAYFRFAQSYFIKEIIYHFFKTIYPHHKYHIRKVFIYSVHYRNKLYIVLNIAGWQVSIQSQENSRNISKYTIILHRDLWKLETWDIEVWVLTIFILNNNIIPRTFFSHFSWNYDTFLMSTVFQCYNRAVEYYKQMTEIYSQF